MASVLLSIGGSALGASLGMGATGATLLASLGGLAGSYVDQALFGLGQTGSNTATSGLDVPQVLTSSYGRAIPVVYGMARVAGNVVWMSEPKVTTVTHTQRVRSGKFSSREVTTGIERYTEASLAVVLTAVPSLLAEEQAVREAEENGEITFRSRGTMLGVRRLWADGELVYDARTFNLKPQQVNNYILSAVHDGGEGQQPDGLIESVAGVGNVPAFRGLGYIVLEKVRISDYGNRIPNYTAEVVASLPRVTVDSSPEGLCEGRDGMVYAVSHIKRTLIQIDPRTLAVKTIQGNLRAHPWRVACSPVDGHLWITCQGDAAVQRIDPTTGAVLATIPVGNYPQDIVVAGNGVVWVTFPALNRVTRIDPVANAVLGNHTVAGGPWGLCLGKDGDVWVTCSDDLVRLDPSNASIRARIATGPLPWGITCNPVSGHIWVAVNGEDVLKIIDPASNAIIRTRNTGTYPTSVNAHPQDAAGSVAVTLMYGNQVKVYSRIYEQMLEYATVAFPGPCLHLANGDVWVTQTKYDFLLKVEGRQ